MKFLFQTGSGFAGLGGTSLPKLPLSVPHPPPGVRKTVQAPLRQRPISRAFIGNLKHKNFVCLHKKRL